MMLLEYHKTNWETLFSSLADAKQELENREEDYNHRPHSSIGYLTPNEFAKKIPMDKQAA